MLHLITRTKQAVVQPKEQHSLLDMALEAGLDWGFSCSRGTCARCRCLVETGRDLLNEPTDAEWDRLTDEELDSGYRLACQAVLRIGGQLTAVHKPYF